MNIGARLRKAREACMLSQKKVADALGHVRFTLLRWEKGTRIPKDSDLRILAEVYQVPLEWIVCGDPVWEGPSRSQRRMEMAKMALLRFNVGDPRLIMEERKARALATGRPSVDPKLNRPIPEQSYPTCEVPVEGLRKGLEAIADRTQKLLNSRPILPALPGIHPEVMRALQMGLVIPSPELMPTLEEKTLVPPDWFLSGDGFSVDDTPNLETAPKDVEPAKKSGDL